MNLSEIRKMSQEEIDEHNDNILSIASYVLNHVLISIKVANTHDALEDLLEDLLFVKMLYKKIKPSNKYDNLMLPLRLNIKSVCSRIAEL